VKEGLKGAPSIFILNQKETSSHDFKALNTNVCLARNKEMVLWKNNLKIDFKILYLR